MAVALFTIPVLIRSLGKERFGMLALAWLLVGYFGLFDLGLGRALTKIVAERLASGRASDLPSLVWTALAAMMGLGLVGAVVGGSLTPGLVRSVLRVPVALQPEGTRAFALLAVSLPFVVGSAGLRGVLEAQQRFGHLNLVAAVMGSFTFIGPVMVQPFSRSLIPVMTILLMGRLAMWLAFLFLCFHSMPALCSGIVLKPTELKTLLSIGGWMTVSNIIGPLMVGMDRFLIGALISVGAVTYYSTPYEVVTRAWIIPNSLVRVLFPAFAASNIQDQERTKILFDRSIKFGLLALWPVVLSIIVLSQDGLKLWLDVDFARHSTRVMQWIALGVLLNCPGVFAFALIQSMGRPDLTARLHMIQLPFYLLAAWALIGAWGIEGAAIAWAGRLLVDTALLLAMARHLLPRASPAWHEMKYVAISILPALIIVAPPLNLIAKWIVLFLSLVPVVPFAWYYVLSTDEQTMLRSYLQGKRPANSQPTTP